MAGGLVLVTVPGRWLLPGQAGSATRLGTLSPSLQLFLSLCHPPVHFTARLSPTGQKDQNKWLPGAQGLERTVFMGWGGCRGACVWLG